MRKINQKERFVGDKFFIDRPIKINNKLIFDGHFFLGERTFYKVKKVTMHIKGASQDRQEFSVYYGKMLVKLRPTLHINKQWEYSLWGNKQDLNASQNFFTDDMINNINYFYKK